MSKFMKKTKSLNTTQKPKKIKSTSKLTNNFPISKGKETVKTVRKGYIQPKPFEKPEANYTTRLPRNDKKYISGFGGRLPKL